MLKLCDINKKLGDFTLSGINLDIHEGEYYVLLGRSGAGKTQLLELIAGLVSADSGKIFLDNEDITHKKIQDRKIGIVFQDYAIFPHMTVFGNIAYPLKMRNVHEEEIRTKVTESARQMNINHLLNRSIINLSGGERQRIALARTLVTKPRLLLLDEPLSSLDASLKDDMKRLIRKLNRDGHTIIHVTHDYCDALSLANRIGVIHNGRIIQEGEVSEVFSKPVNRFVARYAGYKNFFRLRMEQSNDDIKGISKNGLEFRLNDCPGDDCLAILRNEAIMVSRTKREDKNANIFNGVVIELIKAEHGIELEVDAGDKFFVTVPLREFSEMDLRINEQVWISFMPDSVVVISGQNE
jgi:ABC-type Fe3+/spermidine/putrescine transport system ATPase subunit